MFEIPTIYLLGTILLLCAYYILGTILGIAENKPNVEFVLVQEMNKIHTINKNLKKHFGSDCCCEKNTKANGNKVKGQR